MNLLNETELDVEKLGDIEEVLVILSEESGEVIQQVAKLLRFGINNESNKAKLVDELGDLIAMFTILAHKGYIDEERVFLGAKNKIIKLKKWSNIKDLDQIISNL